MDEKYLNFGIFPQLIFMDFQSSKYIAPTIKCWYIKKIGWALIVCAIVNIDIMSYKVLIKINGLFLLMSDNKDRL